MSNCLRDYLIKFFNEENISIDISIFDNGNIFLEKYKLNYNLIFLDIKMPSIDGMEVAQKIRKIDKKVVEYNNKIYKVQKHSWGHAVLSVLSK